jgi:hypothetical protein
VAFKKPRGKRLLWISTDAQDEVKASRQAQRYVEENYPDNEYGISRTYWRHWRGYSEPITKDEYEFALQRRR